MDVTHGARDDFSRDLKDLRKLRSVQISRAGWLNTRVAGLRDQRRQPADFQLQSDGDQQIGLAKQEQKAGLGFDEVRVLIAAGNRIDLHAVAADGLRERSQVRGGRDDLELGLGVSGR